jgi:hypothetical protein
LYERRLQAAQSTVDVSLTFNDSAAPPSVEDDTLIADVLEYVFDSLVADLTAADPSLADLDVDTTGVSVSKVESGEDSADDRGPHSRPWTYWGLGVVLLLACAAVVIFGLFVLCALGAALMQAGQRRRERQAIASTPQ